MPAPRGVFALLVSLMVASATVAATLPPGIAAAGPAWPSSRGLVLAEVVTGGASASDEYVEIANAAATDADLGGSELVYVTASGTTTTRKASFGGPLLLAPGQHLLVANAAGIYGPLADATYTGGFAADGGAVALRRGDGTVIDAVAWGTATNAYVEGAVAPAPPAKSSLERLPGGSAGNTQDTNDNRADWFVQPNPIPQALVSTPAPGPSATSSPTETEPVTSEPTVIATSTPETTDTPEPSPILLPSATPAATTAAPTATPTTTTAPSPSPSPSSSPSPAPTAGPSASSMATEPAPDLEPIAAVRARPAGSRVRVAGVVTVEPGLVGADGLFAIEDSSGGIFVRLLAQDYGLAVGRSVEIDGTLAVPYGQLEVRDIGLFSIGIEEADPTAVDAELADVGEQTEGSLITIAGTVVSVQTDSGRLTITVSDGSQTVRVLADPPAGLSRSDVARGDAVLATGIVGQHATASGRLDGYRLWLRRRTDLVVQAPLPTETPDPMPLATATPVRAPVPTQKPVHHDLASALAIRGALVEVDAAITATAGLLDIGNPTIVVDDGTAAVAVILPAAADAPRVGMRVHVTGKVGSWEGGPTILASQVLAEGELQAIGPRSIAGPLDGSVEWQLVQVCGRIDRVTRAGSRWRADLLVGGHQVAVLGEPAAAITVTTSLVGRLAVVTGIVRRSTSDSSVFQLLPRSTLDFRLGPSPDALGSAAVLRTTGAGDSSSGPVSSRIGIESLSAYLGRTVTIAGLVTETASGNATIDDGTGEVRVGGPLAADAIGMLEPGDAIEVSGLVRQDDQGLIVEADPASIIELPGDGEGSPTPDDGLAALIAGLSTPTTAVSLAAAASSRRASPVAALPDGLAIFVVLLVTLVAVAGALAMARHGVFPRRLHPSNPLPRSARMARFLPPRPGIGLRIGRGKGQ